MKYISIFTLCSLYITVITHVALGEPLKIAIYSPIFAHSHSNYLGKIADTLTERGHDVTVISPILDKSLTKTGVTKTKDVHLIPSDQSIYDLMEQGREILMRELWSTNQNPLTMMNFFNNITIMMSKNCKSLLSNEHLLNYIKKRKFDIGIAEPTSVCPFAIFEHLEIPVTIGALSTGYVEMVSEFIGEPIFPSFVPGSMFTGSTKLDFLDRVSNGIQFVLGKLFCKRILYGEEAVIKEILGDDFKTYLDLMGEVSYIFTNAHPYLSFPRPINKKTIEIGGIVTDMTIQANETLGDFDIILSKRKTNVLVSFGTMAKGKDMPEEYKKSLISVFEKMEDVTFIWKYEEHSTICEHLPNVYLVKWVPQLLLLSDPRLTLFITHGGLGSTTEVAYLGKPALFIPLFGDQQVNAAMISRYGGSLALEKNVLAKEDELHQAIKTILENPKYKQDAENLSFILKNSPNNGKATLIKYVEFAGKVGRIPNLESNARHLNFFQYYLIDVLCFVLFSVISILCAVIFIIRKCYRLCLGTKKSKIE